MNFTELGLRLEYDSTTTDVYNDFFNKVLSESTYYRRFGGIFSGKKFKNCAEGLQNFIHENDGHMELVLIPDFDDEDKKTLSKKTIDEVITSKWIQSFDQIKEKLEEDHIKALAWMIAHDRLKIKLLLPKHQDGTPLNIDEVKEQDIFREEVGIFYNKDNPQEKVSFHGTIDIDNKAVDEYYQIRVSRPDSELERIRLDHEKFNNFWDGDVFEFGNIICEIKPLSDELLEFFKKTAPVKAPNLKKLPSLFDYQKLAVEKWFLNDCRGVFEMATGTGKTYTAIGCIDELRKQNSKLLVIIAAPYTNLVTQWQESLSKWFIPSRILDKNWTQIIYDEVDSINKIQEDSLTVLICTHAKFARNELLREIEQCKIPTLLIVDEAHHVGSGNTDKDDDGIKSVEGARKGLSESYQYRLGLSATLERHYDYDGTEILKNYFKGKNNESTVFEFSLERAIKEKKLCQYNYHPYFVELTDDEFAYYKSLTHSAIKKLNSKIPEVRLQGEDLMKKRALIIQDAEKKIDCFFDIMKTFTDIRHLLIFCSRNQYEKAEDILDNPEKFNYSKRIDHRRITYNDPPKKKDRTKILKEFANEDWHIILSNKVLDEGMDIPEAKNCAILSSTSNPTQFVQRRGRVLRKFNDQYKDGTKKTNAEIYDILVRTKIDDFENLDERKLELGIIRKQLKQMKLMSRLAKNHSYCLDKIKEFTYGIDEKDLEFEPSS